MAACKVGALLAADIDGVAGVLASDKPATEVARAIGVSATTVKDHRGERCSCTRVDLDTILAVPADEPEATRVAPDKAPAGWQPRADFDTAEGGFIVTEAWEEGQPEPSELALLTERGMDPERWRVTSVRYGEWQQSKRLENGDRDTITLHSKRVNIEPRTTVTGVNDTDLLELFTTTRRWTEPTTGNGPRAVFVHAGGDYQLGKTDGDGVEGTVNRFMDALDHGADQLAWLRSRHTIDTIVLPHLGDCIEGYVSQNGRNRNRTTMATSEQVDLLIHLLCEQVAHYAPLADKVIVPVIPGNHDEEARDPDGLEHHSWATFAAKQLRRTLRMAGTAYDHVRIVTPAAGELTLALDLEGVTTGFGHGHYHAPGKGHEWLAGQQNGMQLIGQARIMFEAHHHHLDVSQSGVKTHVQVPALEGESRWWRHRKGQQSPPGMVTMLVGEHLGRPVQFRDGLTLRTGWDHLGVA